MALTGGRWMLCGTLGCLALAVGFWPPAAESRDGRVYYYGSRGRESRNWLINDVASRYALLLVRDSLLAHSSRTGAERPFSAPTITPLGQPAERLSRAIDTLIQLISPTASAMHTAVAELPQGQRRLPDGTSVALTGSWYVLPPATDGRFCAVLPAKSELTQLSTLLRDSGHTAVSEVAAKLFTLLGPCAFYTEFGKPGTQVEAWLRKTGYNAAGLPDWPFAPSLLSDSLGEEAWNSGFEYSISMRACAHGRLDVCGEMFHSRNPLPAYRNTAIVRGSFWAYASPHYLSDLVRDQGRARFARFWSSDLAPEVAFQNAFGVPMPEWTRHWLLRYAGHPTFGPELDFGAVVWSVALAVALALVTSLIATRRQVG